MTAHGVFDDASLCMAHSEAWPSSTIRAQQRRCCLQTPYERALHTRLAILHARGMPGPCTSGGHSISPWYSNAAWITPVYVCAVPPHQDSHPVRSMMQCRARVVGGVVAKRIRGRERAHGGVTKQSRDHHMTTERDNGVKLLTSVPALVRRVRGREQLSEAPHMAAALECKAVA